MYYQFCLSLLLVLDPRIENLLPKAAPNDPGISLAVIQNGKVIEKFSSGAANVEARVSATPDTNYRLASLTKQFTATAILLLVADSKLRLDQTIEAFFPLMPAYAKTITIRHLLTHTSGLWDYEDLIPTTQKTQFKDADAVRFTCSHSTLYFTPGSKFKYSNTGYAALSEIVERASGMSFAQFLEKRVFQPAGMRASVAFEDGASTVENRAFGYSMRNGKFVRNDQDITSAVLGDGGIYSSLNDLIQWNAALDAVKLLPKDLQEEAFRGTKYGFGWFLEPFEKFNRQWHVGETVGFRTAIQRFPDQKLTVIVLSNRGNCDAGKLSLQIASLYLR